VPAIVGCVRGRSGVNTLKGRLTCLPVGEAQGIPALPLASVLSHP
jgi:hypothetical protein